MEDQDKHGRKLKHRKTTTMTMSTALRPLLEYIDVYRRRVAAPEHTLIRKKYSKYADLSYIEKRLKTVEDETYKKIWESRQVAVDYIKDADYANNTTDAFSKKSLFPSLNPPSGDSM